jgi:hypothetical protein
VVEDQPSNAICWLEERQDNECPVDVLGVWVTMATLADEAIVSCYPPE